MARPLLTNVVVRWAPFITLFTVVCYLLFQQMPATRLFEGSDKWGHFSAFMALVLFARVAASTRRHLMGLLLGLVLFALISEALHASGFWPTRHFSYLDIVANLAGCFVGFAFSQFLALYFSMLEQR